MDTSMLFPPWSTVQPSSAIYVGLSAFSFVLKLNYELKSCSVALRSDDWLLNVKSYFFDFNSWVAQVVYFIIHLTSSQCCSICLNQAVSIDLDNSELIVAPMTATSTSSINTSELVISPSFPFNLIQVFLGFIRPKNLTIFLHVFWSNLSLLFLNVSPCFMFSVVTFMKASLVVDFDTDMITWVELFCRINCKYCK